MKNLEKRLTQVESVLGRARDLPLIVLLDFSGDDEKWREQVERAKETDTPIKIISFGCLDAAETVEEAERLVEAHKSGPHSRSSLRVIRAGEPDSELAYWPGILPDFLDDD